SQPRPSRAAVHVEGSQIGGWSARSVIAPPSSVRRGPGREERPGGPRSRRRDRGMPLLKNVCRGKGACLGLQRVTEKKPTTLARGLGSTAFFLLETHLRGSDSKNSI